MSTNAAWDAILEYYNIFILEREEILIFRPQEMKIVDLQNATQLKKGCPRLEFQAEDSSVSRNLITDQNGTQLFSYDITKLSTELKRME